jgi:hypothetical protein
MKTRAAEYREATKSGPLSGARASAAAKNIPESSWKRGLRGAGEQGVRFGLTQRALTPVYDPIP